MTKKVARQVYKRDREPSRIRKAKLSRTMEKRSKRKGWKFLVQTIRFIPRSSELHSLCKVEVYKLWLLKYSGNSFYGKISSVINMFLLPVILQQTSYSHVVS